MPPSKLTLKFHLDLSASKQVQAALKGVIDGVRNRVLKQSIGKLARIGAKVAKAKAPMGATRFLKNSIGTKYKAFNRGLTWVYVIGPRMNMGGMGPGVPQPGGAIGMRKYDPVRYSHLAEHGRGPVTVKKAKTLAFYTLKGNSTSKRRRGIAGEVFTRAVGPALGQPFIGPAYRHIGTGAMKRFVIQDILAGIQREAAKYQAKGKSIYGP